MKTLLLISALFLSVAAQASTTISSFATGSYTIIKEEITSGNYREIATGRKGPFLKVDCNGGQGYGDEADLKLVSGESVKLKDSNGDFHLINCL